MFFTPQDRKIFHDLIRGHVPEVRRRRKRYVSPDTHRREALGDLVVAVARNFLGTPYLAHTLDLPGRERLVINLREMDCFTLVENTLALALLIRDGKTSLPDFAAVLRLVRYRKGVIDGYVSRLHYSSDWIHDGEVKGLIRDMTAEFGGLRLDKRINFMTLHRDQYPALKNKNVFVRMVLVEEACSKRSFHHIPKERLKSCEDEIANGDLIAITTGVEGLDVRHMGIALRMPRGLHLLHASEKAGQAVVTQETLYGYLQNKKARRGIIVARPL